MLLGVGGLALAAALAVVVLLLWWVTVLLPQGQEELNEQADQNLREHVEQSVSRLQAAAADGTLTRAETSAIVKFWRAERHRDRLQIDALFLSDTRSSHICVRYTVSLPLGKRSNVTKQNLPLDQEPCRSELRVFMPDSTATTPL
ncbi:hypothetical protein ACIBF1_08855 [Spirillospora sp. NPDC050679]